MKIVKIEKQETGELVYNGNYARGLLKKLGKANKKQSDIDDWNKMTLDLQKNARTLGIPESEVKTLIDDIQTLANYSFNKSHALAYSMMAAFTLYLNVYFQKFYYPAVIEYAFDHDKETLDTLKEMKKNGFDIVQPNLITSKSRTYCDGDNIYVGLHNLKQVGNAADIIVKNSPYSSFNDFLQKNLQNSAVNKRAVSALVEYGCFDELETALTRRQIISCFNLFWDNKPTFKKISSSDAEKIQTDPDLRNKLLIALNNKIKETCEYWDSVKSVAEKNEMMIPDDKQFLKDCESKYLGFNFFITPFDKEISAFIGEKINKGICLEDFASLRKLKDVSKVIPVYIASVRDYKDKNGHEMCFMSLQDMSNNEVVVPVFATNYPFVKDKISSGVVAFMLLYNTDDTYRGGEQIMLGTKKWSAPEKFSSFIIPIKQGG